MTEGWGLFAKENGKEGAAGGEAAGRREPGLSPGDHQGLTVGQESSWADGWRLCFSPGAAWAS